ncbi:adenosylcobinamide-GDP ribazoletransferase [uncultured Nitrospira sp.]|uniref:adenosylcobinamide-GDP ribazoletransferase n=1 Tax=uncultured Nitrospira sp. TaxID=157176 RepID=UPI0031402884
MRSLWASFSLAWQLLTIIPLPGGSGSKIHSAMFGASLQWFPLVGFLLGASLVMIDRLLGSLFPPVVLNMVMLTLYVLVTGGLHLDGWADTVDALSGGRDSDHRLTILRDSRIGALGATGLMLILGLRYAGLLALPVGFREAMLFCMPAIGRWAMVIGCWGVVYPRSEGLAAQFIRTVRWRDVLVATTVVGLGLWGMFNAVTAAMLMIVVCFVVRFVVWWMSKKFGGITGDVLGAMNEAVEVLFLILGPVVLVFSEFGE